MLVGQGSKSGVKLGDEIVGRPGFVMAEGKPVRVSRSILFLLTPALLVIGRFHHGSHPRAIANSIRHPEFVDQ